MHSLSGKRFAGLGGIVIRALIVALIIGAGLTLVNQRAALFGPRAFDWMSMGLSFTAPFLVVVISQVLGIRAFGRERGGPAAPRSESFRETLAGHGIAPRAVVTAVVAGTALTAIMVLLAGLDGGQAGPVPPAQIAQVYALPLVFGAVSQALSYRRTRALVLSRSSRESARADEIDLDRCIYT